MNTKIFKLSGIRLVVTSMALVVAGATFNNDASAQNAGCEFGINNSKWFAGIPHSVAWSPSGDKVYVGVSAHPGGTTINTGAANFVGNATDTSIALTKNVMSKNLGCSSVWGEDIFTPNGGLILGGADTYVKPSGGTVAIPGCVRILSINRSLDKDTTIFLCNDNAANLNSYALKFVNDHDPENPVFGTVPYTSVSSKFNVNGIATMGNRIYFTYVQDGVFSSNPTNPHRIKCINYSGQPCPNWNDVIISTGTVSDIQIRPTDFLIFARTAARGFGSSEAQQATAGGVIIFDQHGNLAPGFNFADLNMLHSDAVDNAATVMRFDAAGNLYANMPGGDQAGIIKFDPQGNLDYGFYSNMLKNYMQPKWSSSRHFDVNPVTGMIVSSLTFHADGGRFHAKLGGEYAPGNNLPWYTHFPDNGNGAAIANIFLATDPGYNSGYNTVHFYYNNGKLKVDGESAGNSTTNCGTQPPVVVNPVVNSAHGTLQCSSLTCIPAPTQGVASTIVMKVAINVDTIGTFYPVSILGSGLTLQDPNSSFHATHTGLNEFYVTLLYDGTTPLGQVTVQAGNAGSCIIDLSDTTKENPSVINIWTPENCTYKVIGPDLH